MLAQAAAGVAAGFAADSDILAAAVREHQDLPDVASARRRETSFRSRDDTHPAIRLTLVFVFCTLDLDRPEDRAYALRHILGQ